MDEFLKEFFAVTISGSLYRIIFSPEDERATVEKIAVKDGYSGEVPVGTKLHIGSLDYAGADDFIGIASYGISLYYGYRRAGQKRPPFPEFVNTRLWGGKTSAVISLFLKEDDAKDCLNANDLQTLDLRWAIQTEEVYKAIGADHPKFIFSITD